jgi:MFS family permease
MADTLTTEASPIRQHSWARRLRHSPALVLILVTCALFTDMLLYDMVIAFLPQYLRRLGVSNSTIGLLFGTYAIGALLTTPLMGWVSDRLGWRVPILWGIYGLIGSMALYAGKTGLVGLFIGRFLQGASGAALWTAGWAALASVYPSEARGRAMGTAMTGMSMGTLLGPPLGGALYHHGGYRLPFILAICLAVVLGVAFSLLRGRPTRVRRDRAPRQQSSSLLRDATTLTTLGVVVLGSTLLSLLEPTLPLHLETRLRASPVAVGLLFGLATLAYGLSAPLAGVLSDRWGRNRIMAIGLVATLVTFPLIALPHTRFLEACALVPLGMACAFLLSPTMPELADAVDRHGHATYGIVYALFNTAYAVGMLAGPGIGGLLTTHLGFPLALVVVSAVGALFIPVMLRMAFGGRGVREGVPASSLTP